MTTAPARRSNDQHSHDLDDSGHDELERVEPQSRRHIKVGVSVVDAMDAPEYGDVMEGQMLQVEGKVERHHGEGHSDSSWQ